MKNINKQFYMLHLFLDRLRYDKNMIEKSYLETNVSYILMDYREEFLIGWLLPILHHHHHFIINDEISISVILYCKENYHYEKDCVDFDDDNDDNNDPDDKMTPIRVFSVDNGRPDNAHRLAPDAQPRIVCETDTSTPATQDVLIAKYKALTQCHWATISFLKVI